MTDFRYTNEQQTKILHALQAHGFNDKRNWPQYLSSITNCVRHALRVEAMPLPRASEAKSQIEELIQGLKASVAALDEMCPELQSTLDHYLSGTITHSKFFLSETEQEVVGRLLSSGRLILVLRAIQDAAELANGSLGSHVQPVSEEAMRLLFPEVKEVIRKNSQRKPRRPDRESFVYKGQPREKGIRCAVPTLYTIFERAIGEPPTFFKDPYNDDVKYGGTFYEFAMAALLPSNLAPTKQLPSRILTAYNEFRPKKIKN